MTKINSDNAPHGYRISSRVALPIEFGCWYIVWECRSVGVWGVWGVWGESHEETHRRGERETRRHRYDGGLNPPPIVRHQIGDFDGGL
ncbi:MAG: hypothetical protein WBA93_16450 [Microcoleaceae cyanobacterium]